MMPQPTNAETSGYKRKDIDEDAEPQGMETRRCAVRGKQKPRQISAAALWSNDLCDSQRSFQPFGFCLVLILERPPPPFLLLGLCFDLILLLLHNPVLLAGSFLFLLL